METENNVGVDNGNKPQKKRMKKGWKIALISLSSLLGLVVVVVAVALWLVLTPARLTSIVNRLSDKFILCENHFGEVDLTVIKTFPYVGLTVQDVVLVNPMNGTVSDTLASVTQLSVGINLKEYLKNKNIEVTKLILEDVQANLFVDREGNSNFDVFPKSEDEDTSSSFEMPELVSLESIKVKNLDASYRDLTNGMDALVDDLMLDVDGRYEPDKIKAKLRMETEKISFAMVGDSVDMRANLHDMSLKVNGDTKDNLVEGNLLLTVTDGLFSMNGQEFVTNAAAKRKGDLLIVKGDLSGDMESMAFNVDKLSADVKGYEILVDGDVSLPKNDNVTDVNLHFVTGEWGVKDLLAMLPAKFTEWQKGMSLDAKLKLDGKAVGKLGGGMMPLINANVKLADGRFSDKSLLPYSFNSINADIDAGLDLNENGVSNVDIHNLSAHTGRNNVSVTGKVDDLLGRMDMDATVKGLVYLADVKPMMPSDLNMDIDGSARLNLHAVTNLDQLQRSDFANMKLSGNIGLSSIDFAYDTIYATIPKGNVAVQLPSTMKRGLFKELLSATISCSSIDANLPNQNIVGNLGETKLRAAISNIFDTTQPLRVVCDYDFATLNGTMDSLSASLTHPNGNFAMIPKAVGSDKVRYDIKLESSIMHFDINDSTTVDLAGLSVDGRLNYDPKKENIILQLSPNLNVDFKRGYISLAQMDYLVQIPDIKFNYSPERCEIASANVVFGNSDIYLSGYLTGLEKWLVHDDMLRGELNLTSNYTNVDDLLDAFSGLGSDPDTLEQQRKEDHVDSVADPFIVPKDVNISLHTRIKEATAFDNELREIAGDVTINDGAAILEQVGFVCKAARMQLTGVYRTPRVNHIFVGMDFHLLDINIQELIDMIPYVDTLVPLLNDLEGAADFHLCAETYVNAFYKPKMSTLRAAAALSGQNLVVLDNKDIDRIAKLLQLKKWREDDSKIHLDSLDVVMTVFRKELEVYPFLLSLHKYQIVAEGRHDLSNTYDYHVELVETPLPVRLAVDVSGTMPKLNFALSPKLRYKNLFRPAKRSEVDDYVLKMKGIVRKSLEDNVKESTKTYEGLEP